MFGDVEVETIAWGRVAEYDRGWRAEHVRIRHIWILSRYIRSDYKKYLDAIVSALRVRYGVNVEVDESEREDLEHAAGDYFYY